MIFQIPLRPIPSQSISVVLNGVPMTLATRELGGQQYLSGSADSVVIFENVLMAPGVGLIKAKYTGINGDLYVVDLQGEDLPQYAGWGTRWLLAFSNDA